MALEVTVKHPDFPDGYEFTIDGLGVFPNGKSTTIDEDQEQSFANRHFKSVKDAFADDSTISVKGTASSKVEVPKLPETEVADLDEQTAPTTEEPSGTNEGGES